MIGVKAEGIRLHAERFCQGSTARDFTIYKQQKYMKTKNFILAAWNQLTRKGAWRNIFVTHNAFGIFSQHSHISRRTGKQKIAYPSKTVVEKAAGAMGKKHGVHFSVYKCAWCDGWHIGKNRENKIPLSGK